MEEKEFKNQFGELEIINDEKWGEFLSFCPNKLPPEIDFDKKLIFKLSEAESTLAKLSGVGLMLPNPDLLVKPYLRKEAVSSSRIEGTIISLDEYFQSEVRQNETKNIDSNEVLNYIESINYALKKLETDNIDIDLIKNMHKILMNNVRGKDKFPGEFRHVANWISLPTEGPQDAHFVPPNHEKIDSLISDMIEYMDRYDGVPVLIKCAFMHYQFETIHPFCDGNGRIGRALIILYLIKKNKMSKPLLYISGFFEKYKSEYTGLLAEANKLGKFNNWILFFLEAIKVQSEEALEKSVKLQKLKEDLRNKIQKQTQNTSLLDIVDYLFINPYITIKKVEKMLNTSYPTAKRFVDILIEFNILKQYGESKRDKMYKAVEILNIISY